MSEFLELCKKRQSCRSFAPASIEHEKLVNCVEAARLSPSACNSQPWSFVVVEDEKLVSEVAKTTMQMGINDYIASAKAFIVVLEEHAVLIPTIRRLLDSQYFAKGDTGAAVVTICYEAAAQGLGSCILGIYDREALCRLLDIPTEKRFAGVIALGYPLDSAIRTKIRKPIEQITRFV